MKRFILILCVLAILFSMVALVGCTDDEQEGIEDPTTQQGGSNSDDSVVNKANVQTDDTAKDIFD
jgi:hypothetical protein